MMNKNSANVGDRIAAVMDRDVSGASFDEVMGLLRAAPDELMLEVGGQRAAGRLRLKPSGAACAN